MLDPLGTSLIEVVHYDAGSSGFINQYWAEWDLMPILGLTDLTVKIHYEQFYASPSTPHLVSSDELPLEPPDISLINEVSWFKIANRGGGCAPEYDCVDFQISQLSEVPSPPALWLIGTGLGLIGIARRKVRV